MKNMSINLGSLITVILLSFFGCAKIPGATGQEQIITINELVTKTLTDLYKEDSTNQETVESSVGYVILNNKITKIPLVGAGAGYGVAINTQSNEKTYLKATRFDVGGGWGARSVRVVIIFQDEKKFNDFIDGYWSANAGAEGSAKVGDAGIASGAGSGDVGEDKGYTIHTITDAGVSATATAGIVHVKAIKLND